MSTSQLRNGPSLFEPIVPSIEPLQFKLKIDSDKAVTAFPIYNAGEIPESLLDFMHNMFNEEILRGDTYPYFNVLTKEEFVNYWFSSFTAILLNTDNTSLLVDLVANKSEKDVTYWNEMLLGTFYIKPNYSGRCSHNCNAGFLVNYHQRGQKIGYRLGQIYLQWGHLLGYKYSIFNLVFVTNVGSWKIWDKLEFDRIGLVPRAAILKGYDEPVDAIIYGRDLTSVKEELLNDFYKV
ncbi:hypothetical protein TPHA_0D01180 [Tetrapisispora phaffii CBS 4417]|uniref:N-acetyltransferase domain-containing protein n=1 Tax=Tetrapisispora phaffii (strain ATCC 24235 / CBS 4417 / NBRC 1672 / NRRL Y-8282 / UCD 70-5) TaxID=1071381 RepID=G8BSD8_TETPH|nr:hypothetical protein TPHA_0D01180 [Tetrapisispora phaffii CBS 4417]CCE62759.1 hypothetical protein TPHA_0D01180 [Tetrapisispora phaffii CBS 4417]